MSNRPFNAEEARRLTIMAKEEEEEGQQKRETTQALRRIQREQERETYFAEALDGLMKLIHAEIERNARLGKHSIVCDYSRKTSFRTGNDFFWKNFPMVPEPSAEETDWIIDRLCARLKDQNFRATHEQGIDHGTGSDPGPPSLWDHLTVCW